ncbi:MAG: SipW-dependent-type signal peptide-containing protein, partial [Firmicutes bacterium]|nr:SipW-dependent-type signal peptide-containing protein [Bacillota bacterium]
MKHTKRALLSSLLILTLCVSAFAGSTFAWFSDSVTSSGNIIKSGDLEAKMYWTTAADTGRNSWVDVEDPAAGPIFTDEIKWEPGYTEVRYIKIKNTGNLAFQSKLEIVPHGIVGELAEVIKVYCEDMDIKDLDRSTLLERLPSAGTLKDVAAGPNAVMVQPQVLPGKEVVLTLALKMDEDAGNQYQGKTFGDSFDIRLSATQLAYESDDFDNSYDSGAHFPDINLPVNVTQDITGLVENGVLSSAVTLSGDHGVSVTVPANTAIKDGATELTLKIEKKNKSDSNVSVSENEELKAFDVHVDGIADGNAVPLIVNMGAVLPVG